MGSDAAAGKFLRLAVVGKDVSMSESPALHDFLLGELGCKCVYDKISLSEDEFSKKVSVLFERYDAFNVTIPYKTEIVRYLKQLLGDAIALRSVNTVLSAERAGLNTDGNGFLMMLDAEGISPKGKKVLVLGAGGAGVSCIAKLAAAGAEVFVYECREERMERAYRLLNCFTPLREIPMQRYDLIVNCTGIGMQGTVGQMPLVRISEGERPLPCELIGSCGAAVDLIYFPVRSAFLQTAEKLNRPVVNGWEMLFFQAYLADCVFLKREPNAEEARRLLEKYKERKK